MRYLVLRGPLLGLLAMLFLLNGQSAGAILEWCKSDPVLDIGGKRAHVYVSGPGDLLNAVTGPTVVEITVPTGVPVQIVSTDQGFGYGWDVRITESDQLRVAKQGIEVRVRTYVPATATLPVTTQVTNGNDAVLAETTGTTNTGNTVKAWL